jgi:hypothetical protein
MKLPVYAIAFVAGLFCQVTFAGDESSPFYKVPVGSTLTLNQPLTIQPRHASVRMQYGKVMTYSQIDAFYPNCDFEVRTIAKQATTINPDTFLITKVVNEEDVAAGNWNVFAFFGSGDGGPSHVDYMTIMYLESVKQPDVLRITCTHWEDPVEAEFLSIQQMRKAMGKILTLNIK